MQSFGPVADNGKKELLNPSNFSQKKEKRSEIFMHEEEGEIKKVAFVRNKEDNCLCKEKVGKKGRWFGYSRHGEFFFTKKGDPAF